jgi:hypothetical protein
LLQEDGVESWKSELRGDPLPWLLEPDNPSVRYFALRELLDRDEDDREVRAAKVAIPRAKIVRDIFAAQKPGGYWEEAEKKSWPTHTLVALTILADHRVARNPRYIRYGVARSPRIRKGVEILFKNNQHASGLFTLTGAKSGALLCFTGDMLSILSRLGYGDDARVAKARDAYLAVLRGDRFDLCCSRNANEPCLWAAIAALGGFAALPPDPSARDVIDHLADLLLSHQYDFAGTEKPWLRFAVPASYDLIAALRGLAHFGFARDRRFGKLLAVMLGEQDDAGRWVCRSVTRKFVVEKRGVPSKWVTLNALRVLKAVYA